MDTTLGKEAIMFHVPSPKTGMPFARLTRLLRVTDGLQVLVRWKELLCAYDSLESIRRVYEELPQMLLCLLDRKNVPRVLVSKARSELAVREAE